MLPMSSDCSEPFAVPDLLSSSCALTFCKPCPCAHREPLRRSKGPVAAVPGAETVGSYNSEMIGGLRILRTQARDCRKDILITVPSLGLAGRSVSVIGGSSILEINARGQPMRIEPAIECR